MSYGDKIPDIDEYVKQVQAENTKLKEEVERKIEDAYREGKAAQAKLELAGRDKFIKELKEGELANLQSQLDKVNGEIQVQRSKFNLFKVDDLRREKAELMAELDTTNKRVEEYEKLVKRFGFHHDTWCCYNNEDKCSCGLNKALRSLNKGEKDEGN